MQQLTSRECFKFWVLPLTILFSSFAAHADVVTDWNVIARDIVVESKLITPPANRVMAIIHTAVYKSANAVSQEYPQTKPKLVAAPGASLTAAIASANYHSLLALLPTQHRAIETAYFTELKTVLDGAAKESGIAVGKRAAELVLAARIDDGSDVPEAYRPHTTAGIYVPTVLPAVPHWVNRKPWLLTSATQFRPGPPPPLHSEAWARDFNEVKELGSISSALRTKEQTAIALFWEATLPPIYHGIVHSVATLSNRTPTQNARLFALVTQATDDALIAVFDAKYYYSFWRPVTAIRNGDIDQNDDTQRVAAWSPYIRTPMHPEYPCAHCVVAATVGTILKAEVASNPMPLLTTSSTTANGATRAWSSVEDFIQEVSNARIYDGVHYRTSTEVGNVMGVKIGQNALSKYSLK